MLWSEWGVLAGHIPVTRGGRAGERIFSLLFMVSAWLGPLFL